MCEAWVPMLITGESSIGKTLASSSMASLIPKHKSHGAQVTTLKILLIRFVKLLFAPNSEA
jgi:hypothetical protein